MRRGVGAWGRGGRGVCGARAARGGGEGEGEGERAAARRRGGWRGAHLRVEPYDEVSVGDGGERVVLLVPHHRLDHRVQLVHLLRALHRRDVQVAVLVDEGEAAAGEVAVLRDRDLLDVDRVRHLAGKQAAGKQVSFKQGTKGSQ